MVDEYGPDGGLDTEEFLPPVRVSPPEPEHRPDGRCPRAGGIGPVVRAPVLARRRDHHGGRGRAAAVLRPHRRSAGGRRRRPRLPPRRAPARRRSGVHARAGRHRLRFGAPPAGLDHAAGRRVVAGCAQRAGPPAGRGRARPGGRGARGHGGAAVFQRPGRPPRGGRRRALPGVLVARGQHAVRAPRARVAGCRPAAGRGPPGPPDGAPCRDRRRGLGSARADPAGAGGRGRAHRGAGPARGTGRSARSRAWRGSPSSPS